MKKIMLLICLVLSFIFVSCENEYREMVKMEVVVDGNIYVGEKLEEVLDKFIIFGYDSFGKKKEISIKDVEIVGFDTSEGGGIELVFNYKNVSTTVKVEIIKANLLYLEFIEEFDNIIYEGETVEDFIKKISLKVFWEDSKLEEVIVNKEMISGFEENTLGKKEIKIKYGGAEVKVDVNMIKLLNFDVEIDHSVSHFPFMVIEHMYEAFKIIGNYSDGITREIEPNSIDIRVDGDYKSLNPSATFIFEKNGKIVEKKYNGNIIEVAKVEFKLPGRINVENVKELFTLEEICTSIWYDKYSNGIIKNNFMDKNTTVFWNNILYNKPIMIKRNEINFDEKEIEYIKVSLKNNENKEKTSSESYYRQMINLEYETERFSGVKDDINKKIELKFSGNSKYMLRSHISEFGYEVILKKDDYIDKEFEYIYIGSNIDIIENGTLAKSLNSVKYIYIDDNKFDLEKIFGGKLPESVVITGI